MIRLMQVATDKEDQVHHAAVSDEDRSQGAHELQETQPIPIPDFDPHPAQGSKMQIIAQICHDYFFLLLLGLVLLEVFVLPLSPLSLAVRSIIAFSLSSVLIAFAQGVGSMAIFWLAMGIIVVCFYGDILMDVGPAAVTDRRVWR
jgi:hypothetical protein